MQTVVKFEYEKETKGAVRFKEATTSEPIIGTLYIRKSGLAGKVPAKLTVTINAE